MAVCQNCGAPLPEKSLVCTYCGARNDVDLQGIHHYTVHAPDSQRICPRCEKPLMTIDLKIRDRFLIERCDTCFGLFFDPGELEALLEATVANVYNIDHHRINQLNAMKRHEEYPPTYIRCPVCQQFMRRVNFGARSGVIVDRCGDHGLWVDGGELRHLMDWIKAGGQLLNQQREIERQQAERRQIDYGRGGHRPRLDSYSYGQGYDDFDSFGSQLRIEDIDLFQMVKKAAGFLIRLK